MALAARSGKLHRNFQGYTTDPAETLIGFGATSIGRTPRGYVQNIAETGAWTRAVGDGILPVSKGLAFTGDDRLRADVIECIMCDGQVDLAALGLAYGAAPDWFADSEDALRDFEADGLITRSGAEIRLTPTGQTLCRVVAAAFDRYLSRSEARHSVAV
jgi:oxygen-independent coproporphyrinogen-3 oxidase